METRYRVSLNGTQLDELLKGAYKNKLIILDIQHATPENSLTIETPGARDGGIITKRYRQKASVTITFMLRLYDTAQRNDACQKVKTWAAAGGDLKTNDRANQTLFDCICEQFPEIESAKNWTDPLTITFSAYSFPYWQNTGKVTKTLTGTDTKANLDVPGNAGDVFGTAKITPQEDISWFEVRVGYTAIRINATLKKNNTVTIDYDEYRNLRIQDSKGNSLMAKRSATSADDLVFTCGIVNLVKIKADGKIKVLFEARGAWL